MKTLGIIFKFFLFFNMGFEPTVWAQNTTPQQCSWETYGTTAGEATHQFLAAGEQPPGEHFSICGEDFNLLDNDGVVISRVACNMKKALCLPLKHESNPSASERCQQLPNPAEICAQEGFGNVTGWEVLIPVIHLIVYYYGGNSVINFPFVDEGVCGSSSSSEYYYCFNPAAQDSTQRCSIPMAKNLVPEATCYESYLRSCRATGNCPNDPVSFCENEQDCVYSFAEVTGG